MLALYTAEQPQTTNHKLSPFNIALPLQCATQRLLL
jgi:hypothetical protein